MYLSRGYGPKHNKYEKQDYLTSLPLLLVNHQLSAETKSALGRLSTKLSYNLDVMFVNEAELWPTWLSVPALSNRVDTVVATFRIFGCWNGKGYSALRGGAPIGWCFYSLMERFLKRGPVGERKAEPHDRNVTIGVLIFNFLSPPAIDILSPQQVRFNDWLASRQLRHPDTDMLHFVMRPEWLAELLGKFMIMLLNFNYHTAKHGMILYERIGTIRFCVDGEPREEFDLGKRLAGLRFHRQMGPLRCIRPREEHAAFFWRWKKDVLLKRKEAGLPVVYPEDPELSNQAIDTLTAALPSTCQRKREPA
jgi:hypothetical protein